MPSRRLNSVQHLCLFHSLGSSQGWIADDSYIHLWRVIATMESLRHIEFTISDIQYAHGASNDADKREARLLDPLLTVNTPKIFIVRLPWPASSGYGYEREGLPFKLVRATY